MSDFEPNSFEEIINLLPERCRPCQHAQELLGILMVFASSTGGPAPTLNIIHEYCPGYAGKLHEDVDPQSVTDDSGQTYVALPYLESQSGCRFPDDI